MNRGVPRHNRNDAIELLRGFAALAVALVHLTFGFARFVDGRIPDLPDADRLAQAAVAAFFVISGAVMVLSAGPRAARPVSPRIFLSRRAIRVLPTYWIATGILVLVSLWLGQAVDVGTVVRSLAFLPPGAGADLPFLPYLWPGWTLAFELVFYGLFGACLLAGRNRVVPLCAAALAGLVVAGWALAPDHYALRLVTAPHLLLFVAGLGFGTAIARGWRAAWWQRIAGAVLALAALLTIPASGGWLASAGVPGVLAFMAVASGPVSPALRRPARIAGDASYAIYLLHVPFAHAWMNIFQAWLGGPGGAFGYLVLGVPLLILLSVAFHHGVERPIMRSLNRLARSDRHS